MLILINKIDKIKAITIIWITFHSKTVSGKLEWVLWHVRYAYRNMGQVPVRVATLLTPSIRLPR
jgi:hypothetical protein